MHRRSFLSLALAALAATPLPHAMAAGAAMPNKTRWQVRTSEGFDALAFLGPLSGTALYTEYYGDDAAAFAKRLPAAVVEDIAKLSNESSASSFGLLGPNLSVLLLTNGNDASIDSVVTALRAREQRIRPGDQASQYWVEADWTWFDNAAPRLEVIFKAMADAGFAAFRNERVGAALPTRVARAAQPVETGGSLETWLANAVSQGRLAPGKLHSVAAHVLELRGTPMPDPLNHILCTHADSLR